MGQRTILLPTLGSAGDVHPVIALGQALKARGHRAIVVTNAHFQPLAQRAGLEFIALGTEAEYQATIDDPDLWHPTRGFQVVARHGMIPLLRPLYELIAGFEPAETTVASSGLLFGARIAHEKLGTPLVTVHLQPSLLRSVYQPPNLGGFVLPDWLPHSLKRAYFNVLDALFIDRTLAPAINAFRAELGLAPVKHVFGDWLHSPQKTLGLFPEWYAPPQPDWPAQVQLTGFIGYDASGHRNEAPAGLAEFLEADERPIVFTPGTSMQYGRPFFQAALEATQILGRRAIFLSQHREHIPASLPDGIIYFEYIPFSQVLPQASALVYHGGIGTLAQGLAAGIPHLVMPMSHDQPDNALRLKRLGVGDSLTPAKFRGPAVARKLNRLLGSAGVQARCRDLAQRIDFKEALRASCRAIENVGADESSMTS